MGFFDLFSKEGREAAKSKWEYDECYRTRQEKLLSFRQNAIHEIMFKYPDARLLLNRLDRRFMVLLKSQSFLLIGKFADDYYPCLDYVGDAASTNERCDAVARYRKQVALCRGNISREKMSHFKNMGTWLSNNVTNSFQSNGFAITGSADLRFLVGGSLFLNGRKIAKASISDPKPKGYFSTKILEEVIKDDDRRPGTQSLVFVTADCNPVGEGQKMSYEILFDRSLLCLDEKSRNEYAGAILTLRDFMYEIEDHYRRDYIVDENEWGVDMNPNVAADLESPDRNEDKSIESRYLL